MTPPLFFEHAALFRAWLAAHAASERELLVGFHKTATGRPSMRWAESVDEALCFGWIDGVRKRMDNATYSIRFTPRLPGSIWSAINIAKVQALTAAGRMTPPGLAAFALRSETKSVIYAYEQAETGQLTPEEELAIRQHPAAWAYWQKAPPFYRKQILHRITSAKKPATRAARLARLIEASAAGLRC